MFLNLGRKAGGCGNLQTKAMSTWYSTFTLMCGGCERESFVLSSKHFFSEIRKIKENTD